MKRTLYLLLSGAILAALLVTLAPAQNQGDNLAEYARQHRKQKQNEPPPKKSYDNDNLPREEHINVVGVARVEKAADAAKPGDDAAASNLNQSDKDGSAQPDAKAKTDAKAEAADDRQKAFDDWQKKIAEQKSSVDLLQRELDVSQREYRLRAAAMYADAGNRLRNSAQWDKEDKQYKAQIDAKQKAVDAAKQKLADLQEQARRAGVPSKMRE